MVSSVGLEIPSEGDPAALSVGLELLDEGGV